MHFSSDMQVIMLDDDPVEFAIFGNLWPLSEYGGRSVDTSFLKNSNSLGLVCGMKVCSFKSRPISNHSIRNVKFCHRRFSDRQKR